MGPNKIESECIDAFREGRYPTHGRDWNEMNSWLGFGLTALLNAGKTVRRMHLAQFDDSICFKDDNSPVTPQEAQIERELRDLLVDFGLDASIVGEETGGTIAESGYTVAIDPVDGTWSLIGRTDCHATCIAVFRDGQAVAGMVLNPSVGELSYGMKGAVSRVLRLSLFGENDSAADLPLVRASESELLVNIQPSIRAESIVSRLYRSWRDSEVRLVRSPGGSPTLGMLEAAKGGSTYLNAWSDHLSDPYDLAPGVLLVRGAGGDVVDLKGRSIQIERHAGPFIAGRSAAARNRVAAIASLALSTEGNG